MPAQVFPEGQDPLDPPGVSAPGRMPTGANPPDPWNYPTSLDVLGAAFRQNNPIVSALSAITQSRADMTPVPGYDPVTRLSGTKDDDLIEQSLADVNPAQTDARIARKNAELADRQTLASSGWGGTIASVAAGATDPSWFVPIFGEARAAAGLGMAARAVRGLAEGGLKSGISESALQQSQVTRTPAESGANVATNTLLMGLIGGGMAMLSPAERAGAKAGLDKVRADLSGPNIVPEQAPGRNWTIEDFRTISGARVANVVSPEGKSFRFDLEKKSDTDVGITEVVQATGGRTGLGAEAYQELASHLAQQGERLRIGIDEGAIVAGRPGLSPAAQRVHEKLTDAGQIVVEDGKKYVVPQTTKGALEQAAAQPELPLVDKTTIVPDGVSQPKVLASDLSAAASDARTMQLAPILLPDSMAMKLKEIPGVGAAYDYANKILMGFSPTLRIFSSGSLVAKRAMGDLAETSLRFTQADSGITTARGSIPVDRLVKMQTHEFQMIADQIMRIAYRGLADTKFPMQAAGLADIRGQAPGKLSFDDFKTEISLAGSNGDVHAVPEVQNAVQQIRKQVIDPVTRLAQRVTGPDGKPMLAEDLEPPKGDKSFWPRVINKRAVAANFNGFRDINTDWLEGEQGIKARAKDRIIGLQRDLEAASAKMAKAGEDTIAEATAEHDAIRGRIESEIAAWQGKSVAEAKSAIKAREKYRTEAEAAGKTPGAEGRLTSADSAVDRAVNRIIASDRDLSRQELAARAAEIANRVKDAPDGRLPYDIASGGPVMGPPGERNEVRGSLNRRNYAIPTSLIKDFVNTDAQHVISTFLRTVLPDIHLTDRFGDTAMTETFKKLNEEYDQKLAAAGTAKQQTALDQERTAMIRDLAASRDRVRNVYGWDLASTQPNAARIANVARNWNILTDLGTSVFNRLNDSTNAVWRHGLMNVFRDAYFPFFKSMIGMGEGFATAQRQAMRDLGVGVDSAISHMSHQYGDVIDNNMPGNKFERALAWAANKSMMVNLHAQWTDGMKTAAGGVAAADFLRAAERFTNGTQTAQDVRDMAQAGIEATMAKRIWAAYSDNGGKEFGKGTHVANTADWTDTQARDVFASAVARSADMAVLTPGLEKPLWMSSPVVSLLGQYKSFVAAAHEKVLISNLQQADGRTLQGLIAALGMGAISYRAYTLWSGAPTSDRPQDWIKEAVSRSAMLSWFTEINSMQAKFTGGSTDMFRAIGADHPLSRRASNSALSELLGPTYSRLEGMAGGVNDAFHGTWTAMDTHKFRQAIWLQNLFAVRRLLDAAEDGFNEHLGVKPLNRNPALWPGTPAIQMQAIGAPPQ